MQRITLQQLPCASTGTSGSAAIAMIPSIAKALLQTAARPRYSAGTTENPPNCRILSAAAIARKHHDVVNSHVYSLPFAVVDGWALSPPNAVLAACNIGYSHNLQRSISAVREDFREQKNILQRGLRYAAAGVRVTSRLPLPTSAINSLTAIIAIVDFLVTPRPI